MYFEPTSELGGIQRRTGYIAVDPDNTRNVYYLEVVKPLQWDCSSSTIKPDVIPVGSLTWAYNYATEGSIHPEDNKLCANIRSDCFRLIKTSNEVEAEKEAYNPVTKYRFKNKEEFIKSGRWIHRESCGRDGGYPEHWASDGGMNGYLGQVVSNGGHEAIATAKERARMDRISFDGWSFREWNFIGANTVPPPREMPGVERMPPSFRDEVPKAVITPPQPIQQVDWRTVGDKPSLSSTSENTASIRYMEQKETITDDIVIESTINITI
jgi:hypothetical protein